MKILRLALLAAFLVATASARTQAQENRYDLLGRMLMPFANVLAKTTSNPNRAMSFSVRLEQMTDLPTEFAGSHADLSLEYPDKLRLHGPLLGEDVTICRRGEELWAFPGSKIESLLASAAEAKKLPRINPKFKLEPFTLPVPEKELVFLPALFQLKDVGSESVDGEPCRVMDVYLMPQLVRSLKAQGWAARVWIGNDAKPVRISVAKPGWMVVVRIDHVEFAPKLPESTWEPTAEQAGDVMKLDSVKYQQLLGMLVK